MTVGTNENNRNTMDDTKRQEIVDTLLREKCSCVICSGGGAVHKFYGRGVSDLYRLLATDPQMLDGAFVADKVVGKGAAALMVLGRIRELYADIISSPALLLLETYGIKVSYRLQVPNIMNRTNTGICPVETLCLDCRTPDECLPLIENFIKTMMPTK